MTAAGARLVACAGVAALALVGAGASGAPPSGQRGDEPSAAWPVRFVDVAREAGLTQPITYGDVARKRFIIETNGCGVAMIDLDEDGWVDLVTLNGTELAPGERRARAWPAGQEPRIRVYRNQRGTFVDATASSGLDRIGWASSLCAGDADGDGRVDVFHT